MKPIRIAALLAFVTLIATSSISYGQAPARDAELDYLDLQARGFLNRLSSSSDVAEAYAELLKGGPLARSEGLSSLEQKTRAIPERFGEFRAVEQISARRIGKDVVTLKYLYHCDTYPVVWHITYYRSYKRTETPRDENWHVVSIRFDTNVENLTL